MSEFSQLVNLATIVSRTLQPQDGRIRCPVDRNLEFFLTFDAQFLFILGQCVDREIKTSDKKSRRFDLSEDIFKWVKKFKLA